MKSLEINKIDLERSFNEDIISENESFINENSDNENEEIYEAYNEVIEEQNFLDTDANETDHNMEYEIVVNEIESSKMKNAISVVSAVKWAKINKAYPNVVFNLDKYDSKFLTYINKLTDKLAKLNIQEDVPISICMLGKRTANQSFSDSEIEILDQANKIINEKFNREELLFKFSEPAYYNEEYYFQIEEIKNAQSQLNQWVNEINSKNLSPFEKFLYAYDLITDFPYTADFCNNHLQGSVVGVLNSRNIVCTGYSYLLATLTKLLNDNNVKTYVLECNVSSFQNKKKSRNLNKDFAHQLNLVYVNDEKYGIKGYGVSDGTLGAPLFNIYSDDFIEEEKAEKVVRRDNTNWLKSLCGAFYPVGDMKFLKEKFSAYEGIDFINSTVEQIGDFKEKFSINLKNIPEAVSVLETFNSPAQYGNVNKVKQVIIAKKLVNEVKENSNPVSYEKFEEAYHAVLNARGFNQKESAFYLNSVLEKSKDMASNYFISGAKNAFYNKEKESEEQQFIKQENNITKERG